MAQQMRNIYDVDIHDHFLIPVSRTAYRILYLDILNIGFLVKVF